MENITVGLDDEAPNQIAVDWVIDRARRKQVRVRLVIAFDGLASNPMAAQQLLALNARRVLNAAPGTVVQTVLADRSIMEELIEQSASADLLVIGSHPHQRLRSALTRSFPVGLAARSHCAIVLVPDDWTTHDGAIAVGLAADHSSDAAALFAAREAIDQDRELEVVHTWEPWNAPQAGRARVENAGMVDDAIARIHLEYPTLRAHGVLVEAHASDGIIASTRDSQLVVLGTHRLGVATGMLLGSTGQGVVHRAAVALCIVPLVAAGSRPESVLVGAA